MRPGERVTMKGHTVRNNVHKNVYRVSIGGETKDYHTAAHAAEAVHTGKHNSHAYGSGTSNETIFRGMMSSEGPAYKPESAASKSAANTAARESAGLQGSKLTGKTRKAFGETQYEVAVPNGTKEWADEGSRLHSIASRNSAAKLQNLTGQRMQNYLKKTQGGK